MKATCEKYLQIEDGKDAGICARNASGTDAGKTGKS
jgi:hypothetical protein